MLICSILIFVGFFCDSILCQFGSFGLSSSTLSLPSSNCISNCCEEFHNILLITLDRYLEETGCLVSLQRIGDSILNKKRCADWFLFCLGLSNFLRWDWKRRIMRCIRLPCISCALCSVNLLTHNTDTCSTRAFSQVLPYSYPMD